MKLTSRGRYALPAMLDLLHNSAGKAIKLKTISDRQGIPLNYLSQLFRKLCMNGVVKSVRGPGGGYVLGKLPNEITVKEVLLHAGELTDYNSTIYTDDASTDEQRAVSVYFTSLDKIVEDFLSKTLDQLHEE